MRFVIAQRGARRGYAVPAILEAAGMLERFYTDLAGNLGPGKWLAKCGRLLGFAKRTEKLEGRRIPDSIRARTVTVSGPDLRFYLSRAFIRKNRSSVFRHQLRWSQALGRAMAQRGFGQATHFYSMLGECSPLLGAAKAVRLTTVTEFYILLSTERIVAREQGAFSDWESPLPDLNAVRGEFADEQQVIARTDFAMCPSEAVQLDLEQKFGFGSGRSTVVPYGMDENWLALETKPLQGRVLFVGTAGLRKGIHYLAKAAQQLHRRGRCYEFRIAGEVSGRISGHAECRHLKFLGRLPRSRVQDEFSAADVFVLPSLAEGSAEVTYEALGAGVPVVTTAAAGSVVRDGIEGFIVPERDSGALANAIERVVENRSCRAELAEAARARAREHTFERYGERLVKALRSFEP